MTICLAFNFGTHALLCADSRITYPLIGLVTDKQKIDLWHGGLVTGAGLAQLLDVVMDRLKKDQPEDTTKIKDIVRQERAQIGKRFPLASTEEVRHWIATTSWLVSYVTAVDGVTKTRVAVLHQSLEPEYRTPDSIHILVDNTSTLIMPAEATKGQADEYQATLTKNLKTLEMFGDFDAHLGHHVALMSATVAKAASDFSSVGRQVQVGIHMADGRTHLTGLIPLDAV